MVVCFRWVTVVPLVPWAWAVTYQWVRLWPLSDLILLRWPKTSMVLVNCNKRGPAPPY